MTASPETSKYFPHAVGLLTELGAEAAVVMVIGGKLGSGAAPAMNLKLEDSPDNRAHNTRVVRALVRVFEHLAGNLERDVAASGVPLEPRS